MTFVATVLFVPLSSALFVATMPSEFGMFVKRDTTFIVTMYVSSETLLISFILLRKSGYFFHKGM